MDADRRRLAQEAGASAEEAVGDWYVRRGFRVLARNHRAGGSELDLIVERDGDLRFVEVKQRGRGDCTLWESIDRRKRARLVRGAEAFLQAHSRPYRYVSLDVALVFGHDQDRQIEVLESAFDAAQ